MSHDDTPAQDRQNTVLSMRLSELRRQHGLSLEQLAQRADLSIGTLSQVERGLSQPSLRTVRKLANAFGLPTAYFFDDSASNADDEDGIVIRDGKGAAMQFGNTGMSTWMLSPKGLQGLQFMLVHIKPGAMSGESNYDHTGMDLGYVLSGTLNLEVEERFFVLGAGDSFCFDSRRPHRFENCGKDDTVVIYINTQ
ncbi:cupin domain-containing protein [Rhodobacteraceae bacterium KMM 6894]|nr:cupin domain-containing protein [Rhodobacteraceae bacterium KMM 6894]